MNFNQPSGSIGQGEANEQYDQWANVGEGVKEPEMTPEDVRLEAAKDVATQLGVNPKMLENPRSMAIIKGRLKGIEYGATESFLAVEEGGKRRVPNEEERSLIVEHVKAAKPITLEEANDRKSDLSLQGKPVHLEGLSVGDDGTTVEESSFNLYAFEDNSRSFGYRSVMQVQSDGGVIIDRTDYSSRSDNKGLYETASSKDEYSADGVLLRSESTFYDEQGATTRRIVTERDPKNPLLSKQILYDGDGEEPVSEKYGILDREKADGYGLQCLQRKEDVDPNLSYVGFGDADKALVFDTREEAESYYEYHPDEREVSVKEIGTGLSRDKKLAKKVEEGLKRLVAESH